MLTKTRSTPAEPDGPGVIPGASTGPVSNASPLVRAVDAAPAQATDGPPRAGEETRRGRFRRDARRVRLHGYAVVVVALVAYLIALAVSNTAHVKVGWVFGSSHVSLVWLVLFTAILGWLLGLATSTRFQWRTRAPRRGHSS